MQAEGSRCAAHAHQLRTETDARRGSARQRGYTSAWDKARAFFLRSHPLCQCDQCDEGRIRLRAATVVDHKVPHRGDMKRFWDRNNWQSMATDCHNRKTAREDGGFGNTT
jgi:5-methylcytosine-specific restriction protein A